MLRDVVNSQTLNLVERLMKDSNGFYLQPENPDFSNIYASGSQDFELVGKVIALHRNVIS